MDDQMIARKAINAETQNSLACPTFTSESNSMTVVLGLHSKLGNRSFIVSEE
jgi:hypothetical protein